MHAYMHTGMLAKLRHVGDWVEFSLLDGELSATDHTGHAHTWGMRDIHTGMRDIHAYMHAYRHACIHAYRHAHTWGMRVDEGEVWVPTLAWTGSKASVRLAPPELSRPTYASNSPWPWREPQSAHGAALK